MLYSKLFGKTIKSVPKGEETISYKLLYQGGFIRKSTAGRYYFLPLGWRVHRKIEAVIREEMNESGAMEMLSPLLHPIELWQETNRIQSVSFELMRIKDRQGVEFALGGTAEEMFVDLVRKMNLSYKDLPFNVYQFSTKFRDELRPRGGLLRVREFVMKDAYSFARNSEDFQKQYQKMKEVYKKIFTRFDLETLVVEADSGYIGGEDGHEFVVSCPIGEDTIFVCDQCDYRADSEKAEFKRFPKNPQEKIKPLKIVKQPEWVCTMKDNIKYYRKPLWRYLKNVVYKDDKGRIIIASIRGDQDVNETKLKKVIGAGSLAPARDKDLEKIGSRPGWVHSWGHKGVVYVGDLGLKMVKNFIGGQIEKTTDTIDVNYGRDFKYKLLADIVNAQEGDFCPRCQQGKLRKKQAVELGHIFQLGFHYTKLMKGADFVDKDGGKKPFYMGCYGVGLGRTMATIVEIHHDKKGIVWPKEVTPFNVHLVNLRETSQRAKEIYQRLVNDGFEVLYDDRVNVSAGEKFADADLIGIPVRLVISKRTGDTIEWKYRQSKRAELLQYNEVVKKLKAKS